MKIKETITVQQKVQMYNGNSVGIFPYMIKSGDSFYDERNNLCLGYYTEHSANKTLSPFFQEVIDFAEQSNLNRPVEQIIGELIRGKYLEKWERIYNALVKEEYSPIYDYSRKFDKTGDNYDETTYNSKVEKDGSNNDLTTHNISNQKIGNDSEDITYNTTEQNTISKVDKVTYNNSEENTGETGNKQTTSKSNEDNNLIYGFNSNVPVGDTDSLGSSTETVVGLDTDNTNHNVKAKTGNDTTNKSGTETDTKTGIDTHSKIINETEAKTGTENISKTIDEEEKKTGTDKTDKVIRESETDVGYNKSPAESIGKELDLRSRAIFYDIVFDDIDSIAALKIYL